MYYILFFNKIFNNAKILIFIKKIFLKILLYNNSSGSKNLPSFLKSNVIDFYIILNKSMTIFRNNFLR